MKKRNPNPNPFADFLVILALTAVFYMAVEGLVYQTAIAANLPANASFTLPDLSSGSQVSPAARSFYGK